MRNRYFKTQFKMRNLQIKIGYHIIIKNELRIGYINARVISGLESYMTR